VGSSVMKTWGSISGTRGSAASVVWQRLAVVVKAKNHQKQMPTIFQKRIYFGRVYFWKIDFLLLGWAQLASIFKNLLFVIHTATLQTTLQFYQSTFKLSIMNWVLYKRDLDGENYGFKFMVKFRKLKWYFF
jgi:hypothetical protein